MQYFMTHEVETYVLVHLIQHHCRTVDFCYFTESPWHVFQHLVVLLIPLLSVFEAFSITLLQRLTFTKLSKGVLTVGSVAFYHVWAQSPLPPHTSLKRFSLSQHLNCSLFHSLTIFERHKHSWKACLQSKIRLKILCILWIRYVALSSLICYLPNQLTFIAGTRLVYFAQKELAQPCPGYFLNSPMAHLPNCVSAHQTALLMRRSALTSM